MEFITQLLADGWDIHLRPEIIQHRTGGPVIAVTTLVSVEATKGPLSFKGSARDIETAEASLREKMRETAQGLTLLAGGVSR